MQNTVLIKNSNTAWSAKILMPFLNFSDNLLQDAYRIVSNKRPGGGAIFQKGDIYKRQVFNAKMQCLSLFTMTRRREI